MRPIYKKYGIGEVFGPALSCCHAQARRRGHLLAFVTARVKHEGLDAWINLWCNRNRQGRLQPIH